MKKSVLFLPAPIRSHIVPALYPAERLSKDYDVYFAVTDEVLAEIVIKQGYSAMLTGGYRVALGMEGKYMFDKESKINRWKLLSCIYNNDLYNLRLKELAEIINKIKPSVIFIDIFNSTDLLVLYQNFKNIQYFFLNPMLSTYQVNGFPNIKQSYWPNAEEVNQKKNEKTRFSIKEFFLSPMDAVINAALNSQFKKLTNQNEFGFKHPIAADRTSALLFENIPEILLAPLEFELSETIRKSNQYYLGLCINEDRKDTELDDAFEERFLNIVENLKYGKKLIYCTFGTFYQGSDRALLNFLNKLLDAIESLEDVEVVFSVNSLVIQTLSFQRKIPTNIHMFSRVAQLKVLNYTDLYVTHGGLGSIKESIHYGVPMLVYPLDLRYDQNGNGFKVEHHGLGLRGVFLYERTEDLKHKIEQLLWKKTYRKNLLQMKEKITSQYKLNDLTLILDKYLPKHETQGL